MTKKLKLFRNSFLLCAVVGILLGVGNLAGVLSFYKDPNHGILVLVCGIMSFVVAYFFHRIYKKDRVRELFNPLMEAAKNDRVLIDHGNVGKEYRHTVENKRGKTKFLVTYFFTNVYNGTSHQVFVHWRKYLFRSQLYTVYSAKLFTSEGNPDDFKCSIYKPGKWEKML